MIFAKIKNLTRYLGQSDTLDAAIRYLQSTDLSRLAMGRTEVDGDRFYVNRFQYETVDPEQSCWEGHEAYADLHVMISGSERIGVSDADSLTVTVRKPEADFIGYEGPVSTWFTLTAGDVLILFPEDAHMVKVRADACAEVEKACLKIKV